MNKRQQVWGMNITSKTIAEMEHPDPVYDLSPLEEREMLRQQQNIEDAAMEEEMADLSWAGLEDHIEPDDLEIGPPMGDALAEQMADMMEMEEIE